jgi:Asp-tRNA(Asn)/Glu-tRNA(Gln) amidotransferase B subunit
MCEFIELKDAQLEKAMKLFDSRIEEMAEIFDASRKGKISQDEAKEKLARSFAQHREKFEELLNQEQRARLQVYENNRAKAARQS